MMNIGLNRDVRVMSIGMVILGFGLLFAVQVIVSAMAADFKESMVFHDQEIAGYLVQHGLDSAVITQAFTSVKKVDDRVEGASLLDKAGYRSTTSSNLLSIISGIHIHYGITSLLCFLLLGGMMGAVLWWYLRRQHRVMEQTCLAIHSFMDGRQAQLRLDGNLEGSMSKLFNSINEMASSLSAHILWQQQSKDFLKQTIADISHQLKTPLAALQMYNEIADNDSSDVRVVQRFVGKSKQELQRIEILIQNLLKITKLDAGAIAWRKQTIKLNTLLQKVKSRFETRAAEEGKQIVLSGEEQLIVNWDEDWMIEAISNLVNNALEHMPQQGHLEISWRTQPAVIQLILKDNGSGIHPEDIHHIFKRFYRSRFSQDKQGIGLGLPLAKAIIEAHEGTIAVESKLDVGTVFTLSFVHLTRL